MKTCQGKHVSLTLAFTALALNLSFMQAVQAVQLVSFQWRNPLPQGNHLNGVTYANGLYLAVGNFGTIITSSDGTNWQLQTTPTSALLDVVCGGSGAFVAAGTNGVILASPDGTNWAMQPSPTANSFLASAFGNGMFVLTDQAGNIFSSPNGMSWTARTSGAGANAITSIAYGNGLFVGVAGVGSVCSSDGIHWSFVGVPAGVISQSSVVFANGYFFSGGLLQYYNQFGEPYPVPGGLQTTNGSNWLAFGLDSNPSLSSIAYGNGIFSANGVASAEFFISSAFTNWTAVSSGVPGAPYLINAETFGGGIFVAVGAFGTVLTSSDAQAWTNANQLFGPTVVNCALASSSNIIVAVGTSNYIYGYTASPVAFFSTNGGASWTPESVGTGSEGLVDVTCGNATFVTVGVENYNGVVVSGLVFVSTNGVTWNARASGVGNGLNRVIYADGNFVSVGDAGTIITSPTGSAWTGRYSGTSVPLNGVAYGAGQFVVVGNGGALLNSSDLSAWIGEYSAVTNDLLQAAYGNGTFVGVGQSGAIVTSSDGTNWQQQDSGVTSDITDIIFNGGHFVAATASSSPSLVLISYDGTNWSTLGLATPFTLQSLCALPSGLLFAGANCAILQTGNLTVPQFVPLGLTQNGFALIFSGAIGQSYHLQSSLDLVNWSDVYSFTNSQNPVSLLDPAATGRRAGFYRMMTP